MSGDITVNLKTDKCGLALCAHSEENHWFVDSGCSRHMTGDQKKFISLKKKNRNVSFRNGSAKIIGKGNATLVNGQGKAQNTLLVEGLKHTRLSVSQICDQGHNVVFSAKNCEIRDSSSGELVEKGVRTPDNVYILSRIQ